MRQRIYADIPFTAEKKIRPWAPLPTSNTRESGLILPTFCKTSRTRADANFMEEITSTSRPRIRLAFAS